MRKTSKIYCFMRLIKVYQASVNVRSGQYFMDHLALLYSSLWQVGSSIWNSGGSEQSEVEESREAQKDPSSPADSYTCLPN